MYKCPNAAGILQYQQLPCEGGEATQIKSIRTSGVPEEEASEKTGQINQLTKQMGRDRRLSEITREISTMEGRVDNYRRAMDSEMNRLKNKKMYANNNLAGATWEQSISDEMNAVASKYDSMIRAAQNRIDHLRKEEDRLREEREKEQP